MALRKQQLMYKEFGMCDGHVCGECSNLIAVRANDRPLHKCQVYGNTSSEATDWAKRWLACGMFNKKYTGGPVIELVRPVRKQTAAAIEEPLDGQISLEL